MLAYIVPPLNFCPDPSPVDYHSVYKDVEGTSTQWDDIQCRLGNLPPKLWHFKPPPFTTKVDADKHLKSKEWLEAHEPDGLEELEDDLDDDRFLEQYRYPPLPGLDLVSNSPVWLVIHDAILFPRQFLAASWDCLVL